MRVTLVFLALATLAAADEVELVNGSVITDCKVTDVGDSYKVVKGNITQTIAKSDVKRVEYRETREDIYKRKAAALKDGDLKGHVELGRWCKENGLTACAAEEWKKVIALSPDHEEARAGLGHVKHEGKWLTEEEAAKAKGLVKHKGRWVTPEERDLDIALDEQRDLDRRMVLEVRKWLDKLAATDEKKRADAVDNLSKFDDKYKVKPYLAAAHTSYKHQRLFVAQELGRIRKDLGDSAWTATKALARRAIWDEWDEVRSAAIKSMRDIAHPDAAIAITGYLDEESPIVRMRAADAAGWFKDLRAVPPLCVQLDRAVDSLRFIEKWGKEIAQIIRDTLITRDGSRLQIPANIRFDVFDKEGRRRLEEERQVLVEALKAVTGQDFGDDVAKWRAWLEKKKAEKPPEKK